MADSTLVQEHNQAVMKKRLLNMKEIAAALNVGRSTAFVLTASAELRSVKIGERRLVPEAALIEFLEGLEVSPPPCPRRTASSAKANSQP